MKRLITMWFVLALFSGSSGASVVVGGSGVSGDTRIRDFLDNSGKKYSFNEEGNYFRIRCSFADGRSQSVAISSKTFHVNGEEYRPIWSMGYMCKGSMPASVARNLLRANSTPNLACWELSDIDGEAEAGIFTIKISADADSKWLMKTIKDVAETADEKEKELLGTDQL